MYLQFDTVFTDLDGKEKLHKLMDHALGGNYPLESAWKMAQLAGACTNERPQLRPTMRKVVVALMTLSSSTQEWEVSGFPARDFSLGGSIRGQ
jgi:chitin elicitor receptor kinase 1